MGSFHHSPESDECDNCFEVGELYYDEPTGKALCDKCSTDASEEATWEGEDLDEDVPDVPDSEKLMVLEHTMMQILDLFREGLVELHERVSELERGSYGESNPGAGKSVITDL